MGRKKKSPEDRLVVITGRVPPAVKAAIQQISLKEGIKATRLVRRLIDLGLRTNRIIHGADDQAA
jgi:hypothetical protein